MTPKDYVQFEDFNTNEMETCFVRNIQKLKTKIALPENDDGLYFAGVGLFWAILLTWFAWVSPWRAVKIIFGIAAFIMYMFMLVGFWILKEERKQRQQKEKLKKVLEFFQAF